MKFKKKKLYFKAIANLLIIFGNSIKVYKQLMKHLQYLNKFFWKYRLLIIIGTIFIVIANLFALYPAEFVRKAFDAILLSVKSQSQSSVKIYHIILKYSGLIISFAILKGLFMFFMRQTIIVMSRKIEFDLKTK